MGGQTVELLENGLRVHDLEVPRRAVADYFRHVPEDERVFQWILRPVRATVPLWREPPCRGGVSHHDAAGCAVAPLR